MPGFIDSHAHRIWARHNWSYASCEEAIRDALSQGWTGLDDLAVPEDEMNALLDLDARGELRLRVNAYLQFSSFESAPLGDWFRAYQPGKQISPNLRIAGLKVFVDFDSGRVLYWKQDELNELVRRLQLEGWTVSMKAISIQSHELAPNAYEYALNGESNDIHRHRIEHSIAVSDEQLARLARLGILVGIQPGLPGVTSFDADTYRMAGENGQRNSWRWRDYHDAGVIGVAAPLNPFRGIQEHTLPSQLSPMAVLYRGVTKIGVGGRKPEPWMLDQALTVEQILPMLTIKGAYATFEEDKKGSLTQGKWADLVILSGNPLATPTGGQLGIRTLLTMIGGRVEYCTAELDGVCPAGVPSTPIIVEPALVVPAGQPIRIALAGPSSGPHAAFLPPCCRRRRWPPTRMGRYTG